MKVLRLTPSFR